MLYLWHQQEVRTVSIESLITKSVRAQWEGWGEGGGGGEHKFNVLKQSRCSTYYISSLPLKYSTPRYQWKITVLHMDSFPVMFCPLTSDALIWNLSNILITDNWIRNIWWYQQPIQYTTLFIIFTFQYIIWIARYQSCSFTPKQCEYKQTN